ncbi:MAG: MauE/DoxX family redox-associated membrane protein [Prevotellaceae bacterium]|nr:MauE/DoxX family redox-associated membrane protein [Prevotellaceae bacterium]
MKKLKEILPLMLKIVLGLVFIASAILKIIDMDQFEIYVYSYHFFSLNFSFLVARAAIIAELVLGVGLVSNCFHKLMWWGSMAMLIGYTLLLIYAQLIGRTDNCHCFGDVLQFNPWQSIIKNMVLMVLFALVYKVKDIRFRNDWFVLAGAIVVSTAAVFAVSPPDNFTSAYKPQQNLNVELFDEAMQQPPLDELNLNDGKKVVCFFSTACDYCQMSAHKLSLMQQFYGFPAENICYIFMGSEEGKARFYELSQSQTYQDVIYEDVVNLLKITNGVFPVILLLEDGEVVGEYEFRSMREKEIQAFMKQ